MLNEVRLTPDGYETDVDPLAEAKKVPQIMYRPFWSWMYPGEAREDATATIASNALAAVVAPVPPLAIGAVDNTASAPKPRLDRAVAASVAPVPPLAIGSVPLTCDDRLTPESVPPSVRLPEVVTDPERVRPLTVPVPPTDVTVPVLVV